MKKLSVAFLWHMHQPLYKDLVTGRYHLPWVRLHSTYSYLDMAAMCESFPGIRTTFNITPSLIWQLKDISAEKPSDDDYLTLSLKHPRDLDEKEKQFILKNFFSCDLEKAIFPLKRFKELFYKRGDDLSEKALLDKTREFSDRDIRDIQVLFNLAWCGFTLKENDDVVKGLTSKGAEYSEQDKKELLDRQAEVTRSILPLYRKLQDEGNIEISTTPYYHPILPLLCADKNEEGYDFQADTVAHVEKAIELYKEVFGRKPRGMWPAEGAVSEKIIPLLAERGIEWMATDEGILVESFSGQGIPRSKLIYKAYRAGEGRHSIDMVFRDINLSNAISFKYSNMSSGKAAHELISDMERIRKGAREQKGDHLVSIMLDGENPWPYYPDGGKVFLSEVYGKISASADLEAVTISDYLRRHKERDIIKKLYRGSWIDRNFRKWIGSPQKNKAWEYLRRARKEIFDHQKKPDRDLLEELYIAEGSDWFWWYDDFGSELNFVFDDLFRLHLSNIYRMLGRAVPHYLNDPIHAAPHVQEIGPAVPGGGEMARYPRVLFVASEAVPYAKTGGLADVAGSLPEALAELGCEVDVIMPLYKCVREKGYDHTKTVSGVRGPLGQGPYSFDIYTARGNMIRTHFAHCPELFDREGIYGNSRGDHPDNAVRFGMFSRAVLDSLAQLEISPDIIHCNDWQTALIPLFLRFMLREEGRSAGVRTLFTIHNMAYQGVFHKKYMEQVGIPRGFFNMHDLEYYGKINFMKSGILYSDAVSTVSHRYAEEIMTPEYGCGLDGLLRNRKLDMYGIPNGVDYSVWNPKKDADIAVQYGPDDLEGKKECKRDLIRTAGLTLGEDAPLIGCVSRLADQKGMDLVADVIDRIVKEGAGLVLLGTGSRAYNRRFMRLAEKYPGKVHVCTEFNDPLAHKIEAGCDIFLMPSRFEPCGLNQMYSIKYGTVPVVRATGGLDDVIVDVDAERGNGNGFKFKPDTSEALLETVMRAVDLFRDDRETWKKVMLNGMRRDHSWNSSARTYLELYRRVCG